MNRFSKVLSAFGVIGIIATFGIMLQCTTSGWERHAQKSAMGIIVPTDINGNYDFANINVHGYIAVGIGGISDNFYCQGQLSQFVSDGGAANTGTQPGVGCTTTGVDAQVPFYMTAKGAAASPSMYLKTSADPAPVLGVPGASTGYLASGNSFGMPLNPIPLANTTNVAGFKPSAGQAITILGITGTVSIASGGGAANTVLTCTDGTNSCTITIPCNSAPPAGSSATGAIRIAAANGTGSGCVQPAAATTNCTVTTAGCSTTQPTIPSQILFNYQ